MLPAGNWEKQEWNGEEHKHSWSWLVSIHLIPSRRQSQVWDQQPRKFCSPILCLGQEDTHIYMSIRGAQSLELRRSRKQLSWFFPPAFKLRVMGLPKISTKVWSHHYQEEDAQQKLLEGVMFPLLLTQAKQNHHEKGKQPFLCWTSTLHLTSTFHLLLFPTANHRGLWLHVLMLLR